MRKQFELQDYEPVIPSPRQKRASILDAREEAPPVRPLEVARPVANSIRSQTSVASPPISARTLKVVDAPEPIEPPVIEGELLKRGHSLSYLGVFTFTFLVYL